MSILIRLANVLRYLCRMIRRTAANNPVAGRVFRHALIQMYMGRNRKAIVRSTKKTPWVFCGEFKVEDRVQYIEKVYSDYFCISGLSQDQISECRILEIGPGESLGVALKMLACGAKEVICVDRFDSLLEEQYQWMIYAELISRMSDREKLRVDGVFRWVNGRLVADSTRISYCTYSAEEVDQKFPKGYFDLIVSRAVLEHVFDIDAAMAAFDRVLRSGGTAIHEIDFRDHGIFTDFGFHPLTMFLVDQRSWEKMSSHVGAPNRRLLSYFKKSFSANAYSQSSKFLHLFGSDQVRRSLTSIPESLKAESIKSWIGRFGSQVCVETDELDLFVASAMIVATKQ